MCLSTQCLINTQDLVATVNAVTSDPECGTGTSGCSTGDYDGDGSDTCTGTNEGAQCIENIDSASTWEGICVENNCYISGPVSVNCGASCTNADLTDANIVSSCSSTSGDSCDSGIGSTGYTQDGTCTSSGCTTSGAIGLVGGTYYAGCAATRECDSSATGGDYTRDGWCVSSTCDTSNPVVASTVGTDECGTGLSGCSAAGWSNGDEDTACDSGNAGAVCDTTPATGPTGDGICVDNSCDTSTVSLNCGSSCENTDLSNTNLASSCASTTGDSCESGSIGSDGFNQEGTCTSSGCTTSGVIGLVGGTYYAGCAATRECDSSVTGGDYTRNGYCASTSCCTSTITSGETSSSNWDDGDEACSCGTAGDICDNTAASGPSDVGICASSTCETSTVCYDGADYYNVMGSCSDDNACDSDVTNPSVQFTRDGYVCNTQSLDCVVDGARTEGQSCCADANCNGALICTTGTCSSPDSAPRSDTPLVNNTNPTTSQAVNHSVNWSDDIGLNFAYLEMNSTGASCNTNSNVSNLGLPGTGYRANMSWVVTKACEGKTIGWRQWANDSTDQWNVTDWQQYDVQNSAPTVSGTQVNETAVLPGSFVCINATVTDTGIGVDDVWAQIVYPNGTTENVTMSNTTSTICNNGGDVYSVDMNVSATEGYFTVNTTWGNDSVGNIDFQSAFPNLAVSVSLDFAPSWDTPLVNNTNPTTTQEVNHSVNWTDDTALNFAYLEMNSTGASCNTNSNVSNLGLPGTGYRANMSWVVTKACEGKTIGWRQWANDSTDQWNVTDWQGYNVQNVSPSVSNTQLNESSVLPDTLVCINASVSDTGIGVDSVWAQIIYPNGTVFNVTMSNTSNTGCNNGGSVYSADVNVSSVQGNLTVNTTWANDSVGNIGFQSPFPNVQLTTSTTCIYGGGDWNITDTCIRNNEEITLDENASLNILSTGSLTLNNVTIYFNLTANGTGELRVWSGGSLTLAALSGYASMISSTNTNQHYNFSVDSGSSFSMTDSRIEEAGWNDGNPGLSINVVMTQFSGNTLTNNHHGITLLVNGNTLQNNNISNNHGSGIVVDGVQTTKIQGNTINSNSERGIFILNSGSNNEMINNTISGNNQGVYLYNSSGNLLKDCVLSNSVNDVYVRGTSTNTLLNTTLAQATGFEAGSTGVLDVQWYLDVFVKNRLNNPINNVNVSAWNTTSDLYFEEFTGGSGTITQQNVTEYKETLSSKTYATNYTIAVTKVDMIKTEYVNLTQSTSLTIIFDVGVTVELNLKINNTDSRVYIPVFGVGETNASSLGSGTTYASSPHFYLTSQSGDALTGLVASFAEQLRVSNDTNTHSLLLQRNLTNTKMLLPFFRGGWHDVEKRIPVLESGEFFQEIKPTFGFGLGVKYPIKMILTYNNIDLQGDLIAEKGLHKIKIESNKTNNEKAVIIEKVN
ncbi:MAG: right-handed parallel beta-helix repeat-containing protein [Candidatus Aenigmatarchaeota archaeon]